MEGPNGIWRILDDVFSLGPLRGDLSEIWWKLKGFAEVPIGRTSAKSV